MPWHRNIGWPIYTRHPEPAQWVNSRDLLGLSGPTKTMFTAVHEAAHAILYLQYGVPVDYVVLYEEAEIERAGVDASTYPAVADVSLRYGDYAAVLAAGECAQDRWLRQEGLWTPGRAWSVEHDARHDRERLDQVVADCMGARLTFGTDLSSLTDYAWVCDHASQVLDGRWDAVLAVARELALRRRMTGAQIQQLIDRA